MLNLVYLFLGGGIGTLLRFFVYESVHGRGFSLLDTSIVNLVGSFFIGFCFSLFNGLNVSIVVRNAVIVGLLGGFTTLSAFNFECLNIIENGKFIVLVTYVGITIGIGVLLVFLGMNCANFIIKFMK